MAFSCEIYAHGHLSEDDSQYGIEDGDFVHPLDDNLHATILGDDRIAVMWGNGLEVEVNMMPADGGDESWFLNSNFPSQILFLDIGDSIKLSTGEPDHWMEFTRLT